MVGIVEGTFLVIDTLLDSLVALVTAFQVELAHNHRPFHLHHDRLEPFVAALEGTFQVIAFLVIHIQVIAFQVVHMVVHRVVVVHHRGAQQL